MHMHKNHVFVYCHNC